MVRRHLGFSVDEWESLPWWQVEMYIEGLREEFGGERPEDDEDPLDKLSRLGARVVRL